MLIVYKWPLHHQNELVYKSCKMGRIYKIWRNLSGNESRKGRGTRALNLGNNAILQENNTILTKKNAARTLFVGCIISRFYGNNTKMSLKSTCLSTISTRVIFVPNRIQSLVLNLAFFVERGAHLSPRKDQIYH